MRKEVFTQYRHHIYTLYLRVQKRNYERLVFFSQGCQILYFRSSKWKNNAEGF